MVSVHFLVAGAGFEPIIARLCRLTSCGARHFLGRRYTALASVDRGPFPFSLHPTLWAVESKAGYSLGGS